MKTLLEFIQERSIDIDSKILVKVVDILNRKWLYVSDEIVVDWMGYKRSESTIRNFLKEMRLKYRDNVDYKEVDKNHELVQHYRLGAKSTRGGALKKFYIVTSETLVTMMLRAQTKSSARYAKYFYKIHECMMEYYKYQAEEQLVEFKESIQQLIELPHVREYTLHQSIKYLDIEIHDKSRVGVVYFIREEDNEDFYKIGFTTHLSNRLEQLQVANRRKLKVYRTILSVNAAVLESIVHRHLEKSWIRGEWYQVNQQAIDRICEEFSR